MSDWIAKAKDFLRGHPDQVRSGVEKVEDLIDDKTGGKYTEHIEQGSDALQEQLGLPPEPQAGPDETQPMPTEPASPTEPTVPTEPPVPTEPTVPAEPTIPTEPAVPSEPVVPRELPVPEEPNEPLFPGGPELPREPMPGEIPEVPHTPEVPRPPDVPSTTNEAGGEGTTEGGPTDPEAPNPL